MTSRLSASIVTHNHRAVIAATIDSLRAVSPPVAIHVVDHESKDGTAEFVETMPRAVVHRRPNRGYGAGHNFVILQSSAEYHLIVNPDVIIPPGTIEYLLDWLDKHPDVGAVTPQMRNPDGSIQRLNRRAPTLFDSALRYLTVLLPFTKAIFRRRLERYEYQDVGYLHNYQLQLMTGSFMLYRRELLQKLGGFDERFFLYFEDTDLSRRTAEVSKMMFIADVHCIHAWGKGQYSNKKLFFYYIQSMIRYFRIWGWKFF